MKKIMKWDKHCRLGLDDIDTQHRLLFAIFGELDEIHNPEEQGPEIKYLINHIRKYVQEHFAYEESFLEKHNYPDLEKHRKDHRIIVEEINHTLTQSKDLHSLLDQLRYLMTIWIKNHILEMDKLYAMWYKNTVSDHPATTVTDN